MTNDVRLLVERWRQKEIDCEHHADDPEVRGAGLAYGECADELSALLDAERQGAVAWIRPAFDVDAYERGEKREYEVQTGDYPSGELDFHPLFTRPAQGWIPVSERLPEDGADVLAWCGWAITSRYDDENYWRTEDGRNPIFMVTHWMPLPTPPEVK
jgi:hypothetical protein